MIRVTNGRRNGWNMGENGSSAPVLGVSCLVDFLGWVIQVFLYYVMKVCLPGCVFQVIFGFWVWEYICVGLARTGDTARSKVWKSLCKIPLSLKITRSLLSRQVAHRCTPEMKNPTNTPLLMRRYMCAIGWLKVCSFYILEAELILRYKS